MEDCKTLKQFLAAYSTEEACVGYLFRSKWPDGFCCPQCSHGKAYRIETRKQPLFQCASCRHQTSLIVGTIMEGSRTPLSKWLLAIFLVSRKTKLKGISALSLAKRIRVTYKTAWLILQKIRHAMSGAMESDKLSGTVHVNSLTYGKTIHSSIELHKQEHPILAAATVNERLEPVRVLFRPVPRDHMRGRDVQNSGTDAFLAQYVDIEQTDQITCFTSRFYEKLLKRIRPLFIEATLWIRETFCGIGAKHLQAYLDEFGLRFNTEQKRLPMFDRLVSLCATSARISQPMLVAKTAPRQFASDLAGDTMMDKFAPFAAIRTFITTRNMKHYLKAA